MTRLTKHRTFATPARTTALAALALMASDCAIDTGDEASTQSALTTMLAIDEDSYLDSIAPQAENTYYGAGVQMLVDQ